MTQDVEALIRATIETKVIEAFNTAPDAIEKLVKAAFAKRVDANGQEPKYSIGEMTYMEWLVGEELRRALQAVVREKIQEPEVQAAMRAQITEALASPDFSEPLAKFLTGMMADEWRWNFSVNVKSNEE